MSFPVGYSPERYWNELEIHDRDLDFIYNLLLEREVPLTTLEMSEAFIRYRLEQLEKEATEAEDTSIALYLPMETYSVGQKVLFPVFANKVGEVVGIRPGENPSLGTFDVIEVNF